MNRISPEVAAVRRESKLRSVVLLRRRAEQPVRHWWRGSASCALPFRQRAPGIGSTLQATHSPGARRAHEEGERSRNSATANSADDDLVLHLEAKVVPLQGNARSAAHRSRSHVAALYRPPAGRVLREVVSARSGNLAGAENGRQRRCPFPPEMGVTLALAASRWLGQNPLGTTRGFRVRVRIVADLLASGVGGPVPFPAAPSAQSCCG